MLNSRNTHLIETSYDRLKSREITFQQYRKNLSKQSSIKVTNIHEHKRYYYTFDNSLLFTESIQNTTPNLSTLNHNVRFLPCQHRGVGIMQYVYALNPVCIVLIVPGRTHQKFPVGAIGHELIREYNDDSSHLTYINKY